MVITEREKIRNNALKAFQENKINDVLEHMKLIAYMGVELTRDERMVLSTAYKTLVLVLRNTLRNAKNMETGDVPDSPQALAILNIIKKQCSIITKELRGKCQDMANLMENHLLPWATTAESIILYQKIMGDSYCILAEFSENEENRLKYAKLAKKAYKPGVFLAEGELPSTDPLRLSIRLNFAVMYYELFDKRQFAYDMAQETFDNAMLDMEYVSAEQQEMFMAVLGLYMQYTNQWKAELHNNPDTASV